MDFLQNKGAEQVISEYMEQEMAEYSKKVNETDLSNSSITPEAKAAFNRKPYYNMAGSFSIKKPVVK